MTFPSLPAPVRHALWHETGGEPCTLLILEGGREVAVRRVDYRNPYATDPTREPLAPGAPWIEVPRGTFEAAQLRSHGGAS